MFKNYTPANWFWHVGGDTSRAWSSAASAYVRDWDADRLTRIDTEESLCDVLAAYGLDGPGPKPPRSIHVAWFRAALADAGKLDAVEAAVATLPRSKQILWEYASEIGEDDADVKSVASALGIDLAAIFDAAEALRAARS